MATSYSMWDLSYPNQKGTCCPLQRMYRVLTTGLPGKCFVKHISKPTIFPKSASHLMPSHNTLWNVHHLGEDHILLQYLWTTYHSFVKITEFWLIPWVLLEAIKFKRFQGYCYCRLSIAPLCMETGHQSSNWQIHRALMCWFLHPSPWSLLSEGPLMNKKNYLLVKI